MRFDLLTTTIYKSSTGVKHFEKKRLRLISLHLGHVIIAYAVGRLSEYT